jgi:glycosyltransferase involved in cell wall biosynthesis
MVGSESASKRPLRICHVAYTFYENDNRVRRYAEALADAGNEVEVVSLRRDAQPKTGFAHGVRVFRIQRRTVTEKNQFAYLVKILWFFLRSMALLSVRHIRHPYDVVHVHNMPDFLVFTALLPKLMGAGLILDIHDILPEFYAGKFHVGRQSMAFQALLLMEKLSCRFADHVIIANDLWHETLTNRTLDNKKCTVVLNYPDGRMFKPLVVDRQRQGRFVMLYPGTLNHHQGLDIAIKAFAIAKNRMPGAELHIYGEGPARDELIKLTCDSGMADCIRIMDPIPLEKIATVIASADVGIVPKRADGFGNEAFSTKTLEFMACGVPVVVSRTKVDQHYFDDTLVSFFVSGSESDLAEVMVRVFENRTENAERIKVAREFALRNSWQERGHEYLSLVDSLVPRSLSSRAIAR